MTDIEHFISHFNFSYGDGNCFWFAFILFTRFSPLYRCIIMYNPIDNHFATLINNDLYDCTGKISLSAEWVNWDNYITYHQIEARRIYRDCIFKVPEEEWNSSAKDPWEFRITTRYPWEFIP